MPRKDKYHDAVRTALEKDGWTITDDPLTIVIGIKDIHIDLGAEKGFLNAEKSGEKIAVEVKTLAHKNKFFDYYQSLGQYLVYRLALEKTGQNRVLYLAIPQKAFHDYSRHEIFHSAWDFYSVNLLVFDEHEEIVLQWILK